MRAVVHCSRLPSEVPEAPSLETFKVRLKRALGYLRIPLLTAAGGALPGLWEALPAQGILCCVILH